MNQNPSTSTKIGRIAVEAQRLAATGTHPLDAWTEVLRRTYAGKQLENQLQHTCPKWAFSGLCNRGVVAGVSPGSCEEAVTKNSAEFALRALELVSKDGALLHNKRELRRRVFGIPQSPGYRQPNGEVDVLLGLWEARLVVPS